MNSYFNGNITEPAIVTYSILSDRVLTSKRPNINSIDFGDTAYAGFLSSTDL